MQSTKLSYFSSFLVVLCFDFFIVQSFHDFVKLSLTTLDPGSLTLKHCGITRQTSNDFNNYDKADGTRDFITTQSVKKLKAHLKKWALAPEGWWLSGSDGRTIYNIDELDEGKCPDRVYCKSRWIREKVDVTMDGQIKKVELEQQLIVTYSIKYRNYLCSIRNRQVERAGKAVEAGQRRWNAKGRTTRNGSLGQTTSQKTGRLPDMPSATSMRMPSGRKRSMTASMPCAPA